MKRGFALIFILTTQLAWADTSHCTGELPLPDSPGINQVASQLSCDDLPAMMESYNSFRDSIEFPIRDIEISAEFNRREIELEAKSKLCQDERFKRCFPDLKTSINKTELNNLFNSWKKDPRFRYPMAGGACVVRANHLAHELAQLGYSVKAVRIGDAPTLIAMERDSSDKLTGNFYDYHGSHSLIEIMVKNEQGELEPYLLDPQFMDQPVPRSEYFKTTIGQDCVKTDDVDNPENFSNLNCYYSTAPQNSSMDLVTAYQVLNNSSMACGWHFDPSSIESFAKTAGTAPAAANSEGLLKILNGTTDDQENLNGQTVSQTSQRDLVLKVYQNLENKLNLQAQDLRQQIRGLEQFLENNPMPDEFLAERRQMLATNKELLLTLERDLLNVESKVQEVRANLTE